MIIGTATAGIPHAALVANILNLPMGYVRSSTKSHGRNNVIEGLIIKGAKVVVIEDLISTGGSCVKVVNILREAGFNVLGVISIFSYNLKKGYEVFEENNVKYHSTTNYDTLIDVALEAGYIKEYDLNKLQEWKKDPTDETWVNK